MKKLNYCCRSFLVQWEEHFTEEAYQQRLGAAACERMRRAMN